MTLHKRKTRFGKGNPAFSKNEKLGTLHQHSFTPKPFNKCIMSKVKLTSLSPLQPKTIIIPIFMLVAFFSSFAASAQSYDVYNNSAACDFKIEFTISNGMFTNTAGSAIVSAGATHTYTPPTGYAVTQVTVFDAGSGFNHATVEDMAPLDDAGHCNLGVVNVEWQSPAYTQIN